MRRIVLACLMLMLCACQRPPMVMPTMFEAGQIAPLADTPDAWRTNQHTIFYATDRRFDRCDNTPGLYNSLRNDSLSLGKLGIKLGNEQSWQAFNAATLNQPDGQRPRPELAAVKRLGRMQWGPAGRVSPLNEAPSEQAFINQLNTAVQQSAGKAITIYIHGFKNSFEEAALTAAELSLYTGGLGPLVMYSWPSLDSLFEYSHDRDSVRYTTAHARRFIEMLNTEIQAGRLDATQINIVAHSTGAEVIGSVLRELGLMSHQLSPQERQAKWRIGKVLLIAPDISTDVARERILKEDLRGMYQQIVVYSSRRDTALRWAASVLYRTSRIGSINESDFSQADRRWLSQATQVTIINVDDQPSSDPIRHSHHRYSGAALSDLLLSLRSDLSPAERGLVRKEGEILWHFADDYEHRVTEAARRVYGEPAAEQP